MSNLRKTLKENEDDSSDSSSSSSSEDEADNEVNSKRALLNASQIRHFGCVNRIRVGIHMNNKFSRVPLKVLMTFVNT